MSSPKKLSPPEIVARQLEDFYELRRKIVKILTPRNEYEEPSAEEYREILDSLQENLGEMEDAARQLHQFYQKAEKRLERVLKASSSIWTRPTELEPEKIPQFTPIENRPPAPGGDKTRIVSFINLKGGVGKTTLTANLVAALASGNFRDLDGRANRPARVLVVDLDFQGTLSQRCAEPLVLQGAYEKGLTSTKLLETPGQAQATFDELTVPFLGLPNARLIPADETLDDKDVRRLNELASRRLETRYYHRFWFHKPNVFEKYDFVFFDCPPRLTASSVCALVASDSVFMPTAPELFDVNAVSRTVNWFGKTRQNLNSFLEFGGAILNRTNNEKGLTPLEEKNKNLIKLACDDYRVHFSDASERSAVLDVFIPRRSGGNYVNGIAGGALPGASQPYFCRLATEVYRRIYQ
ncbi:MAG: ParA family protein [Thermoguttaceae bacterium]|nr:ParA family protein [Thermoguttaceae bacterium]